MSEDNAGATAHEAQLPATTEYMTELKGPERAAVLLLALGQTHGDTVWEALDDEEVGIISQAMSRLGKVGTDLVEKLLVEFVLDMNRAGAIVGNYESTERLLNQYLPGDRVANIMEEIRGPAGRNMWEKLSNVQETVLANYLKNEYPQTVAVVMSKIRSEHAARVLAILPEEMALEVIQRMLRMESVQKEILERLEDTLRSEFMSNLAKTSRRDAHELMADVFNNFDRQTETRFMSALEEANRESAERIKSLMFTFEDLATLDNASAQTLVRQIEHHQMAVALKGANEQLRNFFLSNMSQRAAAMLREEMDVLGPVRLREVDEAQSHMVSVAKELAESGEILIVKHKGEDELIY